jgi:hypothetical protein
MKNFFRLLIVAGLLTAGWMNRDVLRGLKAKATTLDGGEVQEPTPATPAPAVAGRSTPHPATAAKAAATKAYPALGIADSAFNKRFRSFYEEAQFRDPALLSDPNWPLKLAERTAISLGGGAMPATPAPSSSGAKPGASGNKLQGSALDMRPGSAPSH